MHVARLMSMFSAVSVLLTGIGDAQYETPRDDMPREARYLTAGAMIRDFAPRSGFTGGDSLAITYNTWMPMIGYHHGLVDVQLGYTRYTLRGAACSAVFFGVTGSNELPLVRGEPASLVVPVMLSVDYTKSESGGPGRRNFIVGSLGLGTGLKARMLSPGMEFAAHAAAAYHYSFEGFDTGNGSSFAVTGEATLLLRRIPIADGVVLGYRFRHQAWTLDDGRLNYRVTTHGPYIGVLL